MTYVWVVVIFVRASLGATETGMAVADVFTNIGACGAGTYWGRGMLWAALFNYYCLRGKTEVPGLAKVNHAGKKVKGLGNGREFATAGTGKHT